MAAHILMIIIVIFTIPTEPSPSTERDDRAGLVVPSGDVHNNGGYFVDYSYGDLICSPAIDTVADSIFYIATDGGAYISDYLSTYSYGFAEHNLR